MDSKKQQAQRLYMEGKTQKDIAETIGISERTVYTWVHQYAWNKLRLASYQAPVTIADNLCSQLVEMQNAIAAREPGKRYPTGEEAEITRKLIVSLERMKKYPSLSQTMQVLETFRNYIRPVDKDFARSLGNYTERFLNGKSINGYAPYQVEYCVNPVSPIDTFYEEEEETGSKIEVPCPDINTCLHKGNCTYPHCQHPEWYTPKPDPTSLYAVPSINYEHVAVPSEELSHEETSRFPATPITVSDQTTVHEHVEDDTKLLAGATPLLFLGGDAAMRRMPNPAGVVNSQEKTGSIPAISQSGNAKNIQIRIPQTNNNSSPRHITDKLSL